MIAYATGVDARQGDRSDHAGSRDHEGDDEQNPSIHALSIGVNPGRREGASRAGARDKSFHLAQAAATLWIGGQGVLKAYTWNPLLLSAVDDMTTADRVRRGRGRPSGQT